MRRKLIEALTYPRLFVLEKIDLNDCPQGGFFDSRCERCQNCGVQQQCHWMSCLNDLVDLADKPIHTIHASLLYSIKLIEVNIEQMEHDSVTCSCESCTWAREARKLSREYTSKFVWPISSSYKH